MAEVKRSLPDFVCIKRSRRSLSEEKAWWDASLPSLHNKLAYFRAGDVTAFIFNEILFISDESLDILDKAHGAKYSLRDVLGDGVKGLQFIPGTISNLMAQNSVEKALPAPSGCVAGKIRLDVAEKLFEERVYYGLYTCLEIWVKVALETKSANYYPLELMRYVPNFVL